MEPARPRAAPGRLGAVPSTAKASLDHGHAERIITTHGHQNTEADAPAATEARTAAADVTEATEGATAVGPADGAADAAETPAKPMKRRIGVLLGVALVAYLLDLGSKLLVVAKLEHQSAIRLIGDWVQFDVIRNPGAAFGMGQAMTIVFTLIAATVIVVIVRLARKLYSLPWAVALGLLLGGAFGNLTDRIFRSPGLFRGEVVDFISVKHFAVFNLADSAIVCGGILVVLLSFLGTNPDGSVHRDK